MLSEMRRVTQSSAACCSLMMLIALASCGRRSDVYRIGCITPLTGDGAAYGTATRRGLDLALQKVNSGGGIGGRKVEVVCEDDQMSARVATGAIEKLTTIDKVPVIIGAFGSSVTLAIAPIAERDKVVLFSASSTADAIRDAGDYIFRNVPPNSAQGRTAAQFVLAQLEATRACILRMNNDYGVSLSRSFRADFEAGGGTILSEETYNPNATDFRAQLTKISSRRPQVIFFPGHYQESGLILRQARELGITATFVGGDGSYAPELVRIAGSAAEGSYYTLMGMDTSEVARAFVAAYRARYRDEPDVYSAYAYDALVTIAEAIREAGYSADSVKSALYRMRGQEGVTGVTEFDSYGEVDKPFGIYEVQGGRFVLVPWRPQ